MSAGQLAIAFDLSDLFDALRRRHTPTGIQRVQQELCLALLTRNDAAIDVVIYDRGLQNWRVVPQDWLLSLFERARTFSAGEQSWRATMAPLASQVSSFLLKEFRSGEWLLNAGTSWSFTGYFAQVRQLRRLGVRLTVFLHDCIPERHPEYFEPALVAHHSHWLAQLRECAELVLCNSHATRSDYVEIVQPQQAVRVCSLDATWREPASREGEKDAAGLLASAGIDNESFVLTVGTIEPRKNHAVLLRVWERLQAARGAACPKLLCVGRIGWKSEKVLEYAKTSGLLDSTVFFVSDVPDDTLRALYRRCLFTVYLSAYEGWGLPVSESLAAGKVCIAGDHLALREAGGGFATHVDSASAEAVQKALERLLAHPEIRQSEEQRIRSGYRPGSWKSITQRLCAALREVPASPPRPQLPELRPSIVYGFGRDNILGDYAHPDMAEPFCTGRGWHQWESWGTWTRRETAELAFRLRGGERLPALLLGVRSPPGGAALRITLNGKPLLDVPPFEGDRELQIELPREYFAPTTQDMRIVRLTLSASRVQDLKRIEGTKDQRVVGIGYRFITMCAER